MSTTRTLKGAHRINGNVDIRNAEDSHVVIQGRGTASQSGNLLELSDSTDTTDYLTVGTDGTVTINAGTYNGGHIVLGSNHIWMGTAVLRIKSSAPASADDGDPVANLTGGTLTHSGDLEVQSVNDSIVPLRVKKTLTQSGSLFQVSSSTGTTHYIDVGVGGTSFYGGIEVENNSPGAPAATIKATSGGTGDLLKLQDNAGTTDYFAVQDDGLTVINGGAYNSGHLVLGAYHIWVDSTGDLRIKSGAPTTDTDGAVVGTQT